MNFYVILHAIVGASMVICRPVDVNNDDRPLINYISPNEVDYLPVVEKEREAQLEFEGLPSKGISLYDQSQQKVAQVLKIDATPIVDNIKEEEKYGNDGDRPFDRALVGGLEKLSVFVNKVIETPKQFARSIASKVVSVLDQVGAKIVGL